jgi:hypothetical protein
VAEIEQLCSGEKLGLAILEVLGLEGFPARRVIIDCGVRNAAMVYIEAFANDKILKLDWVEGLEGAEIKILAKEPDWEPETETEG